MYAATLIALLALAGGWTLAAGTTTTTGPAQTSNITVTAPNGFSTAVVQSTQLLTVSPALISGLNGPAGTQEGAGNGLNSSYLLNELLICPGGYCAENFSAVDVSSALIAGDSALQLMLTVTQPTTTASGFDVQVEILYTVGATPESAFGTGYFDTGATVAIFNIALYVDLGTSALTLPSVGHIVVTMNGCTSATTCP
ncbi:MAG: hypothetical protein WB809_04525 [Thermoplasmata archaeon]